MDILGISMVFLRFYDFLKPLKTFAGLITDRKTAILRISKSMAVL